MEEDNEIDDPTYEPSTDNEDDIEYTLLEYDDDDEDSDSECDEDEDENTSEESDGKKAIKQMHGTTIYIVPTSVVGPGGFYQKNKRKRNGEGNSTNEEIVSSFTDDELEYWNTIDETKKEDFLQSIKKIKEFSLSEIIPLRFKVLHSDLELASKRLILSRLDQFQKMHSEMGEYHKLHNWLNAFSRLPINKYVNISNESNLSLSIDKSVNYLQNVKRILDETVYGHVEAKNQIVRILAQWISNPDSKGHCIGIQGPMGTAKTSFVKDGLSKALGIPFGFIPLGGASDSSFLEGHSFTYEGSMYGKIAEVLMKTQCMNPILFFDELDKVSSSHRGDEIIGVLTHLTDSSQNERFNDRYFGELDLNLSKALIIFSYNDESLINPILKDRMITIRVKGYTTSDKLVIASDYLLPKILKDYNFTEKEIIFNKDIIENIIQKVSPEEGVRNLKRGLESIVSWINMHKYIPPEKFTLSFPLEVTEKHIQMFLKPFNKDEDFPAHHMYL